MVIVTYDESSAPLAPLPPTFSTVGAKALFGVGISGSGVGVGRAGARNAPHFNGAFFILAQLLGNWGGVSFTLRMITTRWVTSVPGMV